MNIDFLMQQTEFRVTIPLAHFTTPQMSRLLVYLFFVLHLLIQLWMRIYYCSFDFEFCFFM